MEKQELVKWDKIKYEIEMSKDPDILLKIDHKDHREPQDRQSEKVLLGLLRHHFDQ